MVCLVMPSAYFTPVHVARSMRQSPHCMLLSTSPVCNHEKIAGNMDMPAGRWFFFKLLMPTMFVAAHMFGSRELYIGYSLVKVKEYNDSHHFRRRGLGVDCVFTTLLARIQQGFEHSWRGRSICLAVHMEGPKQSWWFPLGVYLHNHPNSGTKYHIKSEGGWIAGHIVTAGDFKRVSSLRIIPGCSCPTI